MFRRQFIRAAAAAGAAGFFPVGGRPRAKAAGAADPWLLDGHIESFHTARRWLTTDFGRIACIDQGAGPVTLFLHGFPLNSYQWRGVVDRLRAHRRCIAPDFLGLGYTQVKDGQSLAPASQAAMLAALLDRLEIGQVDIIANDSGGAVAQLFLAAWPNRVRTMLLTNCDTEIDCPPPALKPVIELAHQGLYARQWLKPWLADKDLARSAQGLGGLCYTRPGELSDDTIECYLAPLVETLEREAQTNGYAVALEPNALAGIEADLKCSHTPVRILWGDADPIFSAASPAYLDRILPNSRGVRHIREAMLFFPEEYPDLIAGEALALWADVGP